jgi:hypothetical protein
MSKCIPKTRVRGLRIVGAAMVLAVLMPATGWAQSSALTNAEVQSLEYMREEEKLAHDVYQALFETWGLRVFENIARSEARHTDAVAALLDQFDLEDPATDRDPGNFANRDLQELYDTLVAQGSRSRQDAIDVGILIEETDIADLEEDLEIVENPDMRRVYENLLRGSRQHLAAFSRQR